MNACTTLKVMSVVVDKRHEDSAIVPLGWNDQRRTAITDYSLIPTLAFNQSRCRPCLTSDLSGDTGRCRAWLNSAILIVLTPAQSSAPELDLVLSAALSSGIRASPSITCMLEPAKSSLNGSYRPPRCSWKNRSATAKSEIQFSFR